MSDWTITLTPEQENALAALVEQWLVSQSDTPWTAQLVLNTIVATNLFGALRDLDSELLPLMQAAGGMSRAEYLPMIRVLSGARKDRLRFLLGEAAP